MVALRDGEEKYRVYICRMLNNVTVIPRWIYNVPIAKMCTLLQQRHDGFMRAVCAETCRANPRAVLASYNED